MPLMIRLNRVITVSDNEVDSYMANGYKPYNPVPPPYEMESQEKTSKMGGKSGKANVTSGEEK